MSRQAGARVEAVGDRGVWVPDGLTGPMVMAGALVLEEAYGLPPYTSRSAAKNVWAAMAATYGQSLASGEAPLPISQRMPARTALIRLLCRCILGGAYRRVFDARKVAELTHTR